MNNGERVFEAEASSVGKTLIDFSGGDAGFKVPEYQRTYDWSKENLRRLMENCCNGFYQLSESNKGNRIPHTFLGTIILVEEKSERGFEGESFALVDGQQRITSLILICCTLYENILLQMNLPAIQGLPFEHKSWLEDEVKFFKNKLHACTTGQLQSVGETVNFPRIVRSHDKRGMPYSEYQSSISQFLNSFHKYCIDNAIEKFNPNQFIQETTETNRLLENYEFLGDLGNFLCGRELRYFKSDEYNVDCVERKNFNKNQLLNLFQCLSKLDESQRSKLESKISSCEKTEGLIRLLLFSSYLLNHVVLTRVETSDEDSAFDLFDALNTTGEPLTAVETLKPLVVKFENDTNKHGFSGSEGDLSFRNIEKYLNDVFQHTHRRHTETKELLISFALYLEGYKLSRELKFQRNYLRRQFINLTVPQAKRSFIKSIADVSEFRYEFWIREGNLGENQNFKSRENENWLRLCLAFLRDMKTSLTIPMIARYWSYYRDNLSENSKEENFVAAVKAITAFVAIRRAYTGGTEGIDNVFRQLMHDKPDNKLNPLSIGKEFSNEIWSVESLKEVLRHNLSTLITDSKQIGLTRNSWVKGAKSISIYKNAKILCRFLLLAATDQSLPESKIPGLLKRTGVESDERNLFNIRVWDDQKYETVEHVAPQNQNSGWDSRIYENSSTPHTIGNLTLLPSKQNSSAGNQRWNHKRNFYNVFAAKTDKERESYIKKAKESGYEIKQSTVDWLKKTQRLQILDSIVCVDDWTPQLIEARSENILELAWDRIEDWLVE